jgi:hypothetical protein
MRSFPLGAVALLFMGCNVSAADCEAVQEDPTLQTEGFPTRYKVYCDDGTSGSAEIDSTGSLRGTLFPPPTGRRFLPYDVEGESSINRFNHETDLLRIGPDPEAEPEDEPPQ